MLKGKVLKNSPQLDKKTKQRKWLKYTIFSKLLSDFAVKESKNYRYKKRTSRVLISWWR